MNSPKLSDKVPRAQGKRTKQQQQPTQQIEHSEEEVELSPVSSKHIGHEGNKRSSLQNMFSV